MRVITGTSVSGSATAVTVSNMSLPGHPYYECEVTPVYERNLLVGYRLQWMERGRKPDVVLPTLSDALNLAIEDDGRFPEPDYDDDEP